MFNSELATENLLIHSHSAFCRVLTNCIWRLLSPNLFSLCCGNASYHIPLEILLRCHLWGLCNLFMQRWGLWGGMFSSFAFRKWGLDLVFFPQSSKLLLLYALPSGSWERVPVAKPIPLLCFLTNRTSISIGPHQKIIPRYLEAVVPIQLRSVRVYVLWETSKKTL